LPERWHPTPAEDSLLGTFDRDIAGIGHKPKRFASTPAPEKIPGSYAPWWLRGERGRVRIEMILDPESPPRVQWLEVTSVPEPSRRLADIAARLVVLIAAPGAMWPDDVELATAVDRPAVERAVRAAEAGFGPVELGPVLEGDGVKTATWRLLGGGHARRLRLELAVEGPDGPVTKVAIRPDTLEPPAEQD